MRRFVWVLVAAVAGCNQIFGINGGNPIPFDDGSVGPDGIAPETGSDVVAAEGSIDAGTSIVDIALGEDHTCIALSTGVVRCWGNNGGGELGDLSDASSFVPVTVSNLSTAVAVAAGTYHSCAMLQDTKVSCWGFNGVGQLGFSTSNTCNCAVAPGDVGLPSGASAPVGVSAGGFMSAAIQGGKPLRWGAFTAGGGGFTTPTPLSTTDTVDEIHVGNNHACYRTGTTVKCWGIDNSLGQLGSGDSMVYSTPHAVVGLTDVKQFAVTADHTCAVTNGGDVYCWGDNFFGQLGQKTDVDGGGGSCPQACSATPIKVSGFGAAVQVAAGDSTSCALLGDGTVWCWGTNTYGETAGSCTTPCAPTQASIANVKRLAMGGRSTCAIKSDGVSLYCWGRGDQGQLGIGDAGASNYVPTQVLW